MRNPVFGSKRSFTISRTRVIGIRIKCGVTSGTRCDGTLRLRYGRTTLGSRTFSVKANKSTTVHLRLTASAYRLLVRRKSLKSEITLATKGSDGKTRTSTLRLTLRARS